MLSSQQRSRVAGTLVALAAGDALGAAYEFSPPLPPDVPVVMGGDAGARVGEWTDDTEMAVVLAQAAATYEDLLDDCAQDDVARRWWEWSHHATDVGRQTRSVFSAASALTKSAPTARVLAQAASGVYAAHPNKVGNGSLMRTAPVALAYLHDPVGLVDAASRFSSLTHSHPAAREACVLWCLAIRHAVLTGELDVKAGVDALGKTPVQPWRRLFDEAEKVSPSHFANNGWVVHAVQAAWSAITFKDYTTISPKDHLCGTLEAAVRAGNDTDTVASIAGALVGALHGVDAIPVRWVDVLHGWPGLTATDLADVACQIVDR